ncbi:MAG: hypothetical protein Q9160_006402 [Pyrenula sp. 1 TL-2023]
MASPLSHCASARCLYRCKQTSRLINQALLRPFPQCQNTPPTATSLLRRRRLHSSTPKSLPVEHPSFNNSLPGLHSSRNRGTIRPPSRPDPDQDAAWRGIKRAGLGLFSVAIALNAIIYFDLFNVPALKDSKKKTSTSTSTSTSSSKTIQNDGPPGLTPPSPTSDSDSDKDLISTGTSHVPTFPRHITLSTPSASPSASYTDTGPQRYQLLGLGIRTVSFLSIQVYVVGIYIAVPDIERLQARLVRAIAPDGVATTLVPSEKAALKEALLDPVRGEAIWTDVLKEAGVRTAIRIVPTRNTDFMHLRDGWVRGITGRTQQAQASGASTTEFSDEAFGAAVADFKAMWGGGGRKSVPKQETLLLTRDAHGAMEAWLQDGKDGAREERVGGVADERISRLIWLGYLAGKNVSSEGARRSVVEGVMEFVERPVGTVAAQVV